MRKMLSFLLLLASLYVLPVVPAFSAVVPFPASFKTRTITTNGAKIYVRVGGHGPAVVLLHGYGETGDMWAPLAAKLAATHTVVVPDLRGMGLSDHPRPAMTRRTKRAISPVFWTRSRLARSTWSPMTSATWSLTRSRPSSPSACPNSC